MGTMHNSYTFSVMYTTFVKKSIFLSPDLPQGSAAAGVSDRGSKMSNAPGALLPEAGAATPSHKTVPTGSRPVELEELSNRLLIHPLSRGLATLLIPMGFSANAVSVMGVLMMVAASACYLRLLWPWPALVGFVFHFGWHVFDGADGEVARRTGTSSTKGELVDGICDHVGHVVFYSTFALVQARSLGMFWAWVLAVFAGVSRIVQSNSYETARRNYKRWVYGVGWIRNNLTGTDPGLRKGLWGRLSTALGRFYVRVSGRVSPDDREVEAIMSRLCSGAQDKAAQARELYRRRELAMVRQAALLSLNNETLAVFLSILTGSPLLFFLFQSVVLNAVLFFFFRAQRRSYAVLVTELESLERA